MLILYSRIRRFIVDLKSYFTMSSSDLHAAVRNAILENNIEALEQLKLSLNEDYRAASTISSDKSFEYGFSAEIYVPLKDRGGNPNNKESVYCYQV